MALLMQRKQITPGFWFPRDDILDSLIKLLYFNPVYSFCQEACCNNINYKITNGCYVNFIYNPPDET